MNQTTKLPEINNNYPIVDNDVAITITPAAKNRILELLKYGNNDQLKLRVYVNGGGCSGFEYCFAFEEQADDDILIQDESVAIIIDPISIKYLNGATLDYKKTLTESTFIVINPNAKATCECEKSFCC